MIKDYYSTLGTKVLEFDSGELLAIISGIIIHPDTGMVEAFWVKPLTIDAKNAILLTGNILEFKKHVYVKSERVFAQADDVIRISEILSENRPFLGNQVRNEAGDSYGKCVNITFDTNTYTLRQIGTRKSFLWFITLDERLFAYNNILRVAEEGIIIQDETTRKEAVINPISPEVAAS